MNQIFVVGFEGKTRTIDIDTGDMKSFTISQLKNKLVLKTGVEVEDQVLQYYIKTLETDRNNRDMTLGDYNIGPNATIMMVTRLYGEMSGASKCALDTYGVKIWDVRGGSKYFLKRDKTRTVSFSHLKGECCVCLDESGLEMPCGHFICPDDLLVHAWEQIKRLKFDISCAKCTTIISVDDIIKFGIPNKEEEQFLHAAIAVNICESQDIQLCPGCQSYCKRANSERPQVVCSICTAKQKKSVEFCWYCLGDWKNQGNYKECGNSDCMKEQIDELRLSPKMEFNDGSKRVSVPKRRACPECFTVIQHESGCNEMTCRKCGNQFCFICLVKTSGGSLICKGRNYTKITCTPAPIQTKLRK